MSTEHELRGRESKVFIQFLEWRRVSEEERLKLGDIITGERRIGLFKLGAVEPAGKHTRVAFVIRDEMQTGLFSYRAEYAGYHIVYGKYEHEQFEQDESARKQIVNLALPYISEIFAYISGRSGISPIILPPSLPGVRSTQEYRESVEGAK